MEKRIFLSYTYDERELAEKVRNILNSAFQGQIKFFFFSTDIKSGTEWKQVVKDAINNSDAIMLILTPKYSQKPWSLIEWSAFWASNRTTYFLTTDDLQLSSLVSPMQDVQSTNMFDREKIIILFETLAKRADIEYFDYDKATELATKTKEIYQKIKEKELKEKVNFDLLIKEYPIFNNLNSTGLVDVENRSYEQKALPPKEFYELAKNEIFTFAISAVMTFNVKLELLKNLLDKGINVYFLLLNPKSNQVEIISNREGRPIGNDIETVIGIVKRNNLTDYPNFRLKFFDFQLNYTSVMIDGNINNLPITETTDLNSNVRIQPLSITKTAHKGVVFQFEKLENERETIYEYFNNDLRNIWNSAIDFDKLNE